MPSSVELPNAGKDVTIEPQEKAEKGTD